MIIRDAYLTGLLALVSSSCLGAQSLMPFGNFQEGAHDPRGTTGFKVADVTTEASSESVFADFKTSTSTSSATYRSARFLLPGLPLNVSFHVMWDRGTITRRIQPAAANRLELRIFNASGIRVFDQRVTVPSQTGR